MHYTSGKLTSVTDTYGRTLGLTYTGSVVYRRHHARLSKPHLRLHHRQRPEPADLRHLQHQPDDASDLRLRQHQLPFALTGITDENGHSYASWAYDGAGRAVSSQLAGGVNFTSVTYFDNNGNRNVTGPLGIWRPTSSRPCRACRR